MGTIRDAARLSNQEGPLAHAWVTALPSAQEGTVLVSDGAWDSPNLGSIQMEPQIASWNVCPANAVSTFTNANRVPRSSRSFTRQLWTGE